MYLLIENGIVLCKLAVIVEQSHTKTMLAEGKSWRPIRIKFNEKAVPGQS